MPHRHATCRPDAFTLLELQVTLVILAVGLLGAASLIALQGRQLGRVETWCRGEPTYTLVGQTSRWMRAAQAAAELSSDPGLTPWQPPVTAEPTYALAVGQLVRDLENGTMSVAVTVSPLEEGE